MPKSYLLQAVQSLIIINASMTIYGHNDWHCDAGCWSEPEELNVAVL